MAADLADLIVDDDGAEVGLVLQPPTDENGLHTLVDRSGVLLARCRDADSLAEQTTAFVRNLAARPAGATPFSLRAVETPAGLAVCPLWAAVSLASAQSLLERKGARVLPGLRVWLDAQGRAVTAGNVIPARLVATNAASQDAPTPAQVVQFLASAASTTADRQAALDSAVAVVTNGVEAVFATDSRPAGLAAAFAD
ncbi:MAG: hypothetical protein GY713_01065 [Actinomycetia bacterium]|nr:hypothetical protein [Actinomycetes bacterium]